MRHPGQLDETPHVMSWEENLKLTHLVGAQVDDYRLRDGIVDCQGTICSTPRLTLGAVSKRDLHGVFQFDSSRF